MLNNLALHLLNASSDVYLLVDRHGVILFANQATRQMLGYEAHELLGSPVDKLVPASSREAHRGHRETYGQRPVHRAMDSPHLDLVCSRKDETILSVQIKLFPLTIDAEACTLAIVRDRHKPVSSAQEDEDLLRSLELMSHDLRHPLSIVGGYTALFAAEELGPVTDAQSEALKCLRASVAQALDLLENLLQITRAGDPRGNQAPEPVTVTRLIQACVENHGPLAAPRNQEIRLTIQDETLQVAVDPRQIRRLMDNLLSNAAKYSPDGALIEVDLRGNEHEVTITVENPSPNIPEGDRLRWFGLRETGSSTPGSGTASGLGLASVWRIVSESRGTVSIDDREGGGVRLRVCLPAAAEAPGERAESSTR